MKYEEFQEVIKDLQDDYGVDKWFPRRVDKLWQLVENINVNQLKHALDQIAEESNYSPSIQKIKIKLAGPIQRAREAKKQQIIDNYKNSNNTCSYCGLTGLVTAVKKQNPYAKYSFRCNRCEMSNLLQLSWAIPEWDQNRYEDFKIITWNNTEFDMQEVKSWQEIIKNSKKVVDISAL